MERLVYAHGCQFADLADLTDAIYDAWDSIGLVYIKIFTSLLLVG